MKYKRVVWRSPFSLHLKKKMQAESVEEALCLIVDKKLHHLPRSFPADLGIIASFCGINPDFVYEELKEDGCLITVKDNTYIRVNKNHSPSRQRFTIAHEIAHKIINDEIRSVTGFSTISSVFDDQEKEEMCNYIAEELLGLSKRHIFKHVSGFNGLNDVFSVCSKLNVSLDAATIGLSRIEKTNIKGLLISLGVYLSEFDKSEDLMKPLFGDFFEQKPLKLRVCHVRKLSSTKTVYLPKDAHLKLPKLIYSLLESQNRNQIVYGKEVFHFDSKHFESKVVFTSAFEAKYYPVYVQDALKDGVVVLLKEIN